MPAPLPTTDEFFDYLNDHVSDDGNVTSLQNWYQTLSVAFFVLAALQLFRCVMSRKVIQYSKLDSKELRAAFLDDAAEARERREENQNEVGWPLTSRKAECKGRKGMGSRRVSWVWGL